MGKQGEATCRKNCDQQLLKLSNRNAAAHHNNHSASQRVRTQEQCAQQAREGAGEERKKRTATNHNGAHCTAKRGSADAPSNDFLRKLPVTQS